VFYYIDKEVKKYIIINCKMPDKILGNYIRREKMILKQIKQLDNLILRNFSINDKEKIIPSPTQMQIMDFLLKNQNNDIYQKDIEKHLNSSRATVSSVLQTMEKNKIINRVTDKIDNRTKKVVLNPKCVELFEKRKKELKKLEETATRNISKKEIDEFLNTLEKMIKNLSN
jgi:DNA-binding MarR family transcriptional regulator